LGTRYFQAGAWERDKNYAFPIRRLGTRYFQAGAWERDKNYAFPIRRLGTRKKMNRSKYKKICIPNQEIGNEIIFEFLKFSK
jgi:hypothetical protein